MTVEITAHNIKRSRPTEPGLARGPRPRCGPTRRVAGPQGRPENAQQKEQPATCKNQSKRNNGWGRGVARHAATGLKKSDGEGTHSDGKSRTAKWFFSTSTIVQQQCTLPGCNGRGTHVLSKERETCTSHRTGPPVPGPGSAGPGRPAGICGCARRRLVSDSESVPRTCRPANLGRGEE